MKPRSKLVIRASKWIGQMRGASQNSGGEKVRLSQGKLPIYSPIKRKSTNYVNTAELPQQYRHKIARK